MRALSTTVFVSLAVVFGLLGEVRAYDPPPRLTVTEVHFSGWAESQAITLKYNATTYVEPPEWTAAESEPAAYKKGTGPVKVRANFTFLPAYVDEAYVKAEPVLENPLGDLGQELVTFTNGYSGLVEFTATGSIPGYVRAFYAWWQWKYRYADPVDWLTANSTKDEVYVLLDTPKAPMSEPWVNGVLDRAVDWAWGQSTTAGVVSAITSHLYNSGATWDGKDQHFTYPGGNNFHLSALLSGFPNVEMDCRDFANFLHVLTNALGVNGYARVLDKGFWRGDEWVDDPYGFDTNWLYPAGGSPDTFTPWEFHQVGWFSNIADASAQVDNDSDPGNPPHSWKLAKGDMGQEAYLDKLVVPEDRGEMDDVGTFTCSIVYP